MRRILYLVCLFLSALLLVGCVSGVSKDSGSGRVTVEGRVIVSGSTYLIVEDGRPIVMHGDRNGLFKGVTTGDVISILRAGEIAESYPEQVRVYECKKISDGSVDDIPAEVIDSLTSMGWEIDGVVTESNTLIVDEPGSPDNTVHETVTTEEVTCSYQDVSASIRVPEGWLYSTDDEGLYGAGFAITLYPEEGEGKLVLSYTDPMHVFIDFTVPAWTTKEEYILGGLPASRIFFAESQYWGYITAGDNGSFMLVNSLDTDTFLSLRDDVELIVGSVKITEGNN